MSTQNWIQAAAADFAREKAAAMALSETSLLGYEMPPPKLPLKDLSQYLDILARKRQLLPTNLPYGNEESLASLLLNMKLKNNSAFNNALFQMGIPCQSAFAGPNLCAPSLLSKANMNVNNIAENSQPLTKRLLPQTKKSRRGRIATFTQKMHDMLSDLEKEEGGKEIASFLPNGRAFVILKPKKFSETVMPKYFKMNHFSSFQRQLNLYEFQRVKEGPDKGAYFHELFARDKPELSKNMKRIKIKGDRNVDILRINGHQCY